MALINRIVAAFALVLALAAPVVAQEISAATQQALADRVASFDAAMKANDMKTVMGALPPQVLAKVASMFSVTEEQLLEAMQQQIDEAMKTVTIVSYGMDVENAEFVTTPEGFTYAFVPTETVIDLGEKGGKMRATSSTLAVLDGETWYLARVDDPQQADIVKEIYPALADVEFPAATTETVEE